ncbi:MAG: hypothetical protein M3R03_10355, partial [Pseudomonadota bacterium]|nr:hypothetical protein [Pseudomonadota bacterium]
EATAEADAEKARAEGREAAFRVDAAGQAAVNEATNILSKDQIALLLRRSMLEALPSIIAAASKPMENIDRISIVDARGLHGEQGASDTNGGGSGNLADAAVAAAMRYRVGGPLIDSLMAELGMDGSSLNGMLSGGSVPVQALGGRPASNGEESDGGVLRTTLNGGPQATDRAGEGRPAPKSPARNEGDRTRGRDPGPSRPS